MCEWCGSEHPIENLCRPVFNRRSFMSLTGLGLLGLGLGPYAPNALAPMIGPRMDLLAVDGSIVTTWRLQKNRFSYDLARNDNLSVMVDYVRISGLPVTRRDKINPNSIYAISKQPLISDCVFKIDIPKIANGGQNCIYTALEEV